MVWQVKVKNHKYNGELQITTIRYFGKLYSRFFEFGCGKLDVHVAGTMVECMHAFVCVRA